MRRVNSAGRCGTHLVHDMVERMVRCPQCGAMEFPKLFPAVIVGIVDSERNKVLVSRYANREYKRYALIAGFCEMGETVEETVHREVMEEVGLRVKNLRYYKSQPWPPSSSLLFGSFESLMALTISSSTITSLRAPSGIDRDQLPCDEDYSLTRGYDAGFFVTVENWTISPRIHSSIELCRRSCVFALL